jgi:hypothetical protein
MVIALVAEHYLHPAVRQRVQTMLAGDTSQLTPSTGIADEATWADKYRDSDRYTTRIRYNLTHQCPTALEYHDAGSDKVLVKG